MDVNLLAARLLVVEDEARLAANLAQGLSEAGYTIVLAGSAEEARARLGAEHYDLLVLDLRLPGQDGLAFLRELRREGSVLPVLILTARDGTADRVTGLDSGADDYLVELLARLRALLRRRLAAGAPVVEVGELRLDTLSRRAWRGRRELGLSPKEAAVLEYLMRHAGVTVARDALGAAVWGESYDPCSNLVGVFINRLRQKIDQVREPSAIVTVRGAGYLLRVGARGDGDGGAT
jgi:DNA-binding response OmpR family regulator